jgi:glycosyltransferase involved in cell wall biosynthesis
VTVIGLSPGMVDCILGEGVPERKTVMIPNCSDLELFSPGPKNEDLLQRFGLAGRFVATYAGAIGPSYDLMNVVRAATLLAGRGRTDIAVLLVGDGKERATIIEERERLGLDNLVVAGSIPKDQLPDLMRSSDVVLVHLADVPILATGSPNKLFDGLSAGRPVIVNSPGWTRPLVEDNGVGLYVPPADPAALADALERLADDRDMTARMGEKARELAVREFDRDDHARRLLEVLELAAGR